MKKYKQPETRIRKVEDGWGVKYYPEYRVVIIPYVFWEWHGIRDNIDDDGWTLALFQSQQRIDRYLEWHKRRFAGDIEYSFKKKVKKKTTIIKYP